MSGQAVVRPGPGRYDRWLIGLALVMLVALLLPDAMSSIRSDYFVALHSVMEMASIVVAVLVFGVVWHSETPRRPVAVMWLACALFASAWLDLAHVMSYPGMPDFVTPAGPEKAIFFWLASRLMVAGTFLAATYMAASTVDRLPYRLLAGYLLGVVAVCWLVLFHQDVLPHTFIPGQGLTPLKVGMEWLVIGLLALTAWRCRGSTGVALPFDASALFAAAVASILSELCFSLYLSVSDAYNLLGHIFKVIAYGLLYRAMFVANVQAPYRALKARGEELAAAHERFRGLVESSPDWLWEVDARGVYTYASPQVRGMLGYGPEEVLGRTPFDFMAPDEADRVRCSFEAMARLQQPFYGLENRNLRKDGAEVVLETSGVPILDEYGAFIGYRGADRDVTERKQAETERDMLERQLHQAQKMEALGRLTGGIAHDFNNLLGSILGYANLALVRLAGAQDGKPTQYLRHVVTASERARDLIAKMLAYSRGQAGDQVVDLAPAPLLRETLKLLDSAMPAGIERVIRVDDQTPAIRINAVEFQQVLINLLVNARDAVGEAGRIEIGLAYAAEVAGLCALCQRAVAGEYVVLEVTDSGAGIAPESLGRVFDPFFTTKEVGQGSGLGLSVVQGIVKNADGHVLVHSWPGRGSTFRVLFPPAGAGAGQAGDTG